MRLMLGTLGGLLGSTLLAVPTQGQTLEGHSLIVKSDGTVWAVGANTNGQIGDNTTTTRTTFGQVAGLTNVVKVATGAQHSMALTSTGALYVWGDNAFGQVGDGSTTDRKTPVLLSLTGVVAIAAGEYHSVALKSNGDSYAWGKNANGQLGKGNTTQGNSPSLILKKVSAIGAGVNHTLFVKTTGGTAFATGLNADGQLGDGTTTQRTAPVQMSGIAGATAVTGGAQHSVVLLSTGALVATGYNADGQLGNGTNTPRTTAGPVSLLTGISTLSTGASHSVARKSDGTVWAWGRNHVGQLGDGTITNRSTPQQVTVLPAITTTDAGKHSVFAVTSNGTVYSWGDNASFQLGDGTTVNRWAPVQVSDPTFAWRVATPALSVSSGTYTADQTVVVSNVTVGSTIHYTQNGIDPTESDPVIASGGSVAISHSQMLKAKAWKTGMPSSAVATAIYELKVETPTFSPGAGNYTASQNVTVSSASAGATLRYTLDGNDPTAGSPLYSAPVVVATTSTLKAVGFKAGWSNSDVGSATYTMNFGTLVAPTVDPPSGPYTSSASVTMSSAQSGATVRYTTDNTPPTAASTLYVDPVSITTMSTVRAKAFHPDYTSSAETSRTYTIAAATPTIDVVSGAYASGSMVTVATTEVGATLRMTIDGSDPTALSPSVASGTTLLLGNFTLKVRAFRPGALDSEVASAVYTLTDPLGPGSLAAGSQHSVLATTDGRVYSWGLNANGQLGDTSTTTRLTPTLLNTITGVTQVAGGLAHTLARTWSGQVYAWGHNGSGRLGDGSSTAQRTEPTLIPTLANVVAVAAGDTHSLALGSDGRVYAWGGNGNGQLGLGSTTNAPIPTEIPALSNVVAIAAGSAQSFAVTSGGQLYAWGLNTNSRLGDGTPTQRTSPVLVNLNNVVSVAPGISHTVALTADGRVYTWGLGSSGQLGLGSPTTMTTPTLLATVQASAIAAGGHFTAAIRHDGVLVAWGANGSGQVGDTTTEIRTTPTVVAGPASVSSIVLGDSHVLAVTPDGALWTWGNGGSGRLGDNSTTPRPTPQSVLTGLSDWRLAAPTISLPSATLNTAQDVAVISSTVGADVRYTLTGAVPTQSDAPVPANGLVSISLSAMLRARAFMTGRASSIDARADYHLEAAAPTIDPPTGTYQSAQTVTISSSDPTATIRFTTDGTDPTPTATVYSAPFVVTTSVTIKARAYPSNEWAPSVVSVASITFGLPVPVATPEGGLFTSAPSVTLSSIAGATIRYTLNGMTPNEFSTLYTSPITIPSTGETLKSIAFHPDWPVSPVRTDVYTVDSIAPRIVASRFPSAFNGWHLTPVTVTFVCSDNIAIASCTPSATFSVEGAGHTVTGTAVDTVGRHTTITETVNLDLTPPVVTMASPADGFITTSSSVTVTGMASDAGSGLATVMCNGIATSIVNGQVSCTVPLGPGLNTLAISALDVAGHSASAAVTISRIGTAPSSLTLTPNARTMLVGDQMPLALRDAFGSAIPGATWSSGNPAVLSLSSDDPPMLSALAPGSAIVSANKDGFTATSTITVIATAIPSGQRRWRSVMPLSATQVEQPPIYANSIEANGPDVFSVATDTTTGAVSVWPVSLATGEAHPMIAAPGTPILGDTFGGLIASVDDKALVRFGGPASTTSWRYESHGELQRPAQGPDGTIYVTEYLARSQFSKYDRSVVVLDGATGAVKARVPLANNTHRNSSNLGCMNWEHADHAAGVLGPIVGGDGFGYLVVSQLSRLDEWTCSSPVPFEWYSFDGTTTDYTLKLLRVSPNGSVSEQVLESGQHFDDPQIENDSFTLSLTQLLPDGIGGLLLMHGSNLYPGSRVTRLDAEGNRADTPLDFGTRIELIGQSGTAYLHRQNAVGTSLERKVVDVRTWQTKWTLPLDWSWVAAGPTDGAVVQNASLQLARFNGSGQLSALLGLTLTEPAQRGDSWTASGSGISSYATDNNDLTLWDATYRIALSGQQVQRRFGNASNQNALRSYFSNYNAIDLITTATPQSVFDRFVRTFAGLELSTIAEVELPTGPITGVGQIVRFTLFGVPGAILGPFEVETIRFDPVNHVIAAKTLQGHPLFGWRYWKVSQPASGRIRVETGAVDRPASNLGFSVSYFLSQIDQVTTWQEYLQRIQQVLDAPQDFSVPNWLRKLYGVWHYSKADIMREVCGTDPPPGVWICQ